jgi:K+/H+ antiporter YhaU regulatory subunit KhtT
MAALISLFVALILSILVTRIATVALTHTGLSRESARFQARSAFTGVGFTTSESEGIVNHPVRRRIVLLLMLLGNAGLVTVVTSLILTFVDQEGSRPAVISAVVIVVGLLVLGAVASSLWLDRRLSKVISWALNRYTHLPVQDYAGLLRLTGDYRIAELRVRGDDWMAGRALRELKLRDEGVIILGITRANGVYVGAPKGPTMIRPGDTFILYGRQSCFEALDRRQKGEGGDREHDQAAREQRELIRREREGDPGQRRGT